MPLTYRRCLIALMLLGSLPLLGWGQIQFAAPVSYDLQMNPAGNSSVYSAQRIAVGDLNGDTRPDIVVSVVGGVAVMLNKGDGTFSSPILYGTGIQAKGLAALALIDVNSDGHLDVVGITDEGAFIAVLLNRGDGTFSTATQYTPPNGFRGKSMAVGDFNGDGRLDLAVAYVDTSLNPNEVILINNGDGTLSFKYTFSAPGAPGDCCGDADLLAADLNGDGLADIIAWTGSLSVLINEGNGQFAAPVNYTNDRYGFSTGLASGFHFIDLNGDGLLDVVTNDYQYAFDYGLNEGGGTLPSDLTGVDNLGASNHQSPLAVGDFDNNGTNDIVALSSVLDQEKLLTFSNSGKGTFTLQSSQSLPYSYEGGTTAVADFDGDGLLDIAVYRALSDGTVSVDILRNTTPTTGGSITVTGVFPPQGGNSGTVSGVNIIGTDFPPDVQVKLTGPGPDINPTNLTVSPQGNLITVSFNFLGAAPGSYTLVLTDSKGNVLLTKAAAFAIEQGGTANVLAEIVAPSALRIGSSQEFFVAYSNTGNVDSGAIAIAVAIPTLPYLTITPSSQFLVDSYSTPEWNIETYLLPSVPAGATGGIPVALSTNDLSVKGTSFQLRMQEEPLSEVIQSLAGSSQSSVMSPVLKAKNPFTVTSSAATPSPSSTSGFASTLLSFLTEPDLYDGCPQFAMPPPPLPCSQCSVPYQDFLSKLGNAANDLTTYRTSAIDYSLFVAELLGLVAQDQAKDKR